MTRLPITEFKYDLGRIEKGYNNRTLYVNLSDMKILSKPVSKTMKEKFIGGRGFDLWLLWNALPKNRIIKWNDPENEICIACGPLGGTPVFPGSGKSIVASISPLTGMVIDSNVGGYFGAYLKFAGWDALEIQGKAKTEVVIFIDGDEGKVQIEDASKLPSETHLIVDILAKKYGGEKPQSVSVVSSGPGAEHTFFGCLNFSWYDAARKIHRYKQAGRGGIGTVLRDKKVKAIVVKYSGKITVDTNGPADAELLKQVGTAYNQEIRTLDPKQNEMATIGTTHLVTIMNEFDLLPVKNFKFGSHPDGPNLGKEVYRKKFHKGYDGCWLGCALACAHGVKDFELKTDPYKGQRVFVNGPEYETIAGVGSNCGIFDADCVIEINYYCDIYGLDTISVGTAIAFAMECYEMGLINKKITGGLDLRFGNKEAALELIHQMARGEGFGVTVGQGVRRMKKIFAEKHGADQKIMQDIGMEAKGLEFSEYVTKESLAQQGGYGLALKGPQHDEAWLIFLDMVHNLMPTFEQKAENLHWFPMFRTWFGLNGLCKLPWNDVVPPENKNTKEPAKVISHVENYAKYFYAVTGKKVTVDDIILMSERVYNFQRIFNLRMGFGTREHDAIPYRAVGPVTKEEYESRAERYDKQLKEKLGYDPKGKTTEEKLAVLRKHREAEYERLKDAVYKRRGWSANGVPTLQKVKELGIDFPDVVELLQKHG
ncbi:MAG: aldehyde ferredoxin oxidoreductase family protein [Candidatus Bathyarchaeia archaeon]|nr:aldehyde:ferredoxin oxidoreductase [Candidatus Bathyarchaeota archaeon A05DMB-4]MDH7595309.1 aldehyde ferredoxin oxidoreductase C-terminal domain-containing protein [Candidatus Bathyarchaeota archaeon]